MYEKYRHCTVLSNDVFPTENENIVFDEEFMKLLDKIKNSINTLSEDDIKLITDNYPNETLFQYIINNCDNLSFKSLNYMMKQIKEEKTILCILNRKFNNTSVILPCLNRLGDEKVKDLLLVGIQNKKCPFSQQTIDFLTRGYAKQYDFLPFAFTTETELMKRYVDNGLYEESHIWIANNELVDENTRNKAYETKIDYENIYNATTKIKEENYKIAIETLTEYENEKDYVKEKENAFNFIIESIKRNNVTEDCQMDLLMHKHRTLLNSKEIIEKEIAVHSKSERVLAHLLSSNKCTNLDAKMLAGMNKQIENNTDIHIATHISFAMKKTLEIIENRGTGMMDDRSILFFKNLYSKFASISRYATSNVDEFKKIVNIINHKGIIMHILCEPNTPIYVLEMLTRNPYSNISFLAKVALELKHKNESVHSKAILTTLNNYKTSLPKPKDRVMDYADTRNLELKFSNRELRHINEDEYKKIKKVLETVREKEDSAVHKRKIKLFIMEMDYNFKKEQKLITCPFLKYEGGLYKIDFKNLKNISNKEMKESVNELMFNEIKNFHSQCRIQVQLLREIDIIEFYNQINDISRLYNILDDNAFAHIAEKVETEIERG